MKKAIIIDLGGEKLAYVCVKCFDAEKHVKWADCELLYSPLICEVCSMPVGRGLTPVGFPITKDPSAS